MNARKEIYVVDVGVGKAVENYLTQLGCEVLCIRDIDGLMEDSEILKIALQKQAMVVTMDKDFGELVYSSGLRHTGVLLLRLEDESSAVKLETIIWIMQNYRAQIQRKFCVFQKGKLRIGH